MGSETNQNKPNDITLDLFESEQEKALEKDPVYSELIQGITDETSELTLLAYENKKFPKLSSIRKTIPNNRLKKEAETALSELNISDRNDAFQKLDTLYIEIEKLEGNFDSLQPESEEWKTALRQLAVHKYTAQLIDNKYF